MQYTQANIARLVAALLAADFQQKFEDHYGAHASTASRPGKLKFPRYCEPIANRGMFRWMQATCAYAATESDAPGGTFNVRDVCLQCTNQCSFGPAIAPRVGLVIL